MQDRLVYNHLGYMQDINLMNPEPNPNSNPRMYFDSY